MCEYTSVLQYRSCELTCNGSSQSQHKLVVLGVVVLSWSFHLLIQRPDEALQSLSSDSQEGLQLTLPHQHAHTHTHRHTQTHIRQYNSTNQLYITV